LKLNNFRYKPLVWEYPPMSQLAVVALLDARFDVAFLIARRRLTARLCTAASGLVWFIQINWDLYLFQQKSFKNFSGHPIFKYRVYSSPPKSL
jgi:hypothetical protein